MNLHQLEAAYEADCRAQGIELAMVLALQPPELVWDEIEQLAHEKQQSVSLLVGRALLNYIKAMQAAPVADVPAELRQTHYELTLSEPGGVGIDWVELEEDQLAEVRDYIAMLKNRKAVIA